MELRPRPHRANGGALRWDFLRELSSELFERADRLAFSEPTLKTSTDQDEAETVHQKNTLLPCSLGRFCNGNAIRFPKPPLGIVSWLGKSRSYESRPISCLFSMVRVNNAHPSLRASTPDTGRSKNIQTCAPFPDRERSTETGTWNCLQVATNAAASAIHDFLSKSTA